MRNIINVSLPPAMTKTVKRAVKNGQYASTSEFFRELVRRFMDEQFYPDVMTSEQEFAAGKGKKLRSLKDLR
jgi:Arc/MetJ-type ribon-helix-helix transcriptional regulator